MKTISLSDLRELVSCATHTTLRAGVVAAVLFSSMTARAEDPPPPPEAYRTPDFINEPAKLPESMDATTARKLTLLDAMQIAIQQNLQIVVRRLQHRSARSLVTAGKGRFEPEVRALGEHASTASPPSTTQEGQAGQVLNLTSDRWNLSLAERIPTGTQLALEFNNQRTRSSLDNAVRPEIFRSNLGLRLSQPLLRGFAFDLDVPYADVLRAELTSERAKQDVFVQMITTVRDTENAYWDVVLALKIYQVQQSSLRLARDQLGLTRRQIDAGLLPPSDLINAEGTLAVRELGLVQAEASIGQFSDQLRRVLNLPRDGWGQAILPLDAPRFDERAVTFETSLEQALRNRPEMKQRRVDVDRAALDRKIASTERLPQLDASFTYGLVGQDATYGAALGQVAARDAVGWSGFVNLVWTPLNIAANANLTARRAAESAAVTAKEQQLLDVYTELRNALRELTTAVRQVRAAGKSRELAERSLDAEQRKFLNGTSSNFFISQRQNELLQAQLAEVSALIRHQKAITALQATTGALLEDRRVHLDVR